MILVSILSINTGINPLNLTQARACYDASILGVTESKLSIDTSINTSINTRINANIDTKIDTR